MCQIEPVPPPNEEARKHVRNLQLLMYVHICVALSKMMLVGFSGLFELISCLILYMAYQQIQFCNCVMYMFFCGMNAITCFIFVGVQIQNGTFFRASTSVNVATAYLLLCLIFYVVAVTIAFFAYREFKALHFEGAIMQEAGNPFGGFGGAGGSNAPYGTSRRQTQDIETSRTGPANFSAFSGAGTAIGGS